jgi:sigma-B regulation protein RsbU (phosphoserine phosphatase)
MRQKITFALVSILALFLLSGAVITLSMLDLTSAFKGASSEEKEARLSQDLVILSLQAQSHLYRYKADFVSDIDPVVEKVEKMDRLLSEIKESDSGNRAAKEHLSDLIDKYKLQLSQFITFSANREIIAKIESETLATGEQIQTLSLGLTKSMTKKVEDKGALIDNLISDVSKMVNTSIILGVLLAFLVARYLLRSITIPIGELLNATHKIAAGDLAPQPLLPSKDEFGELSASFNMMTSRLRDTQNEILQRNQELFALNHIISQISQTLNLKQILKGALKGVMEITDADVGWVYSVDYEKKELSLATYMGDMDESASKRKVIPMNECDIYEEITRTGEVITGKVSPFLAKALKESSFYACIPLRSRNRTLGIITIGGKTGKKLPSREIGLLALIGDQIGIAMENALLYRDIGNRVKEISTLYEVTKTITSTIDLVEVLRAISQRICEAMELSRSMVFSYERESEDVVGMVGHGIEDKDVQQIRKNIFEMPIIEKAIHMQKPIVSTNVKKEKAVSSDFIEKFNIKSLLCIPLISKEETIGFILADNKDNVIELSLGELKLASAIGSQAAIAVQNARTFKQQVQISQVLQKSLLPREIPSILHTDIGVYYQSATIEAEVGGDFYDFIPLDEERTGIVIGDICGKGIEAASQTAMAKYILREHAIQKKSPARVLFELNNTVKKQTRPDIFITIFYGIYDSKSGLLTYANAGHPPFVHFNSKEDSASLIEGSNVVVGVFNNVKYDDRKIKIGNNDVLCFYTDGLTEARADGVFFGEKRLLKIVQQHGDMPAQAMAEEIASHCLEFSSGKLSDDIAIVILKRKYESEMPR